MTTPTSLPAQSVEEELTDAVIDKITLKHPMMDLHWGNATLVRPALRALVREAVAHSERPLLVLLQRGLRQLDAWQKLYGEHNPAWLPPAGDVRWAEDVSDALASRAAPTTERGERVQPSGVEAAIEELEYAILTRAAGAGPMDRVDNAKQAIRALASSMGDPEGEVVITKNDAGQIVAVTRQDSEGRILKVISESATGTPSVPDSWLPIADAPKNGDLVWLGNPKNTRLGFWSIGPQFECHGTKGGGWRDFARAETSGPSSLHFAPTHFQKLPRPPSTERNPADEHAPFGRNADGSPQGLE